MNIAIKADKKLEGKLLASMTLDGEVIIGRLLRLAKEAGFKEIYVYVKSESDKTALKDCLERVNPVFLDTLDKEKDVLILEADCVYHPEKLSTLLKKRRNPESAIIWRLNAAIDFVYAQSLLNKRQLYPIARYYIVPLAKKAASFLQKFNMSPNCVTIFDGILGFVICLLFLLGDSLLIRSSGILILLWWVLDHVDGYLARLLHRESRLGAFLDSFLGSLLWHLMHICIAIGLYLKSEEPFCLILGIFYMLGSFMFVFSNYLIKEAKEDRSKSALAKPAVFIKPSGPKKIISLLDDTDVRIHLLVLSCILNIPIISLIYNASWCNLRWILNLIYYSFKLKKEQIA